MQGICGASRYIDFSLYIHIAKVLCSMYHIIYRQGRWSTALCMRVSRPPVYTCTCKYRTCKGWFNATTCIYMRLRGYLRLSSRLSGLQSSTSSSVQFSPHWAHDLYMSQRSLCTRVHMSGSHHYLVTMVFIIHVLEGEPIKYTYMYKHNHPLVFIYIYIHTETLWLHHNPPKAVIVSCQSLSVLSIELSSHVHTVHAIKRQQSTTLTLPYYPTLLPFPATLLPHPATLVPPYPGTLLTYPATLVPVPYSTLPHYHTTVPCYPDTLPYYPTTLLPYPATLLPRVNNKEEESVEHAFGPSINCSESNVTSTKAHVM